MTRIAVSANTETYRALLTALRPFTTSGSLRGVVPSDAPTAGVLPEPYRAEFRFARPDYVVYSYDTPIAWHESTDGKWHFPNVNYSLTTTQHQYSIHAALQTIGYVTGEAVSLRKGRGQSGVFGSRGDGTF